MVSEERTMQQGFEHLLKDDHERIIFGALKKLNIRPYNLEFDDLLQEARFAFSKAYVKFPKDIVKHDMQFHVYAYQAIYWRIIDILRRQQKNKTVCTNELPEEFEEVELPSQSTNALRKMVADDLFQRLYLMCTSTEQDILVDLYVKGLPGAEISRMRGISRQTVSRTKKRIGLKMLMIISK